MKKIFNLKAYNKRKDLHHIFGTFIFIVMILGRYNPVMWYVQLFFWSLWFLDALLCGKLSKR